MRNILKRMQKQISDFFKSFRVVKFLSKFLGLFDEILSFALILMTFYLHISEDSKKIKKKKFPEKNV